LNTPHPCPLPQGERELPESLHRRIEEKYFVGLRLTLGLRNFELLSAICHLPFLMQVILIASASQRRLLGLSLGQIGFELLVGLADIGFVFHQRGQRLLD
jgi:hypothetical protein